VSERGADDDENRDGLYTPLDGAPFRSTPAPAIHVLDNGSNAFAARGARGCNKGGSGRCASPKTDPRMGCKRERKRQPTIEEHLGRVAARAAGPGLAVEVRARLHDGVPRQNGSTHGIGKGGGEAIASDEEVGERQRGKDADPAGWRWRCECDCMTSRGCQLVGRSCARRSVRDRAAKFKRGLVRTD
jgi:hypothetical protein